METIKNYLDVMFAKMPDTEQMRALKENLLLNMEEKYHELKQEGKSENEAIGIVISEFGNVDELMEELDIGAIANSLPVQSAAEQDIVGRNMAESLQEKLELPEVTEEQVHAFMADKKKSGAMIALGVVLCITAVAMLILLRSLISDGVIGGGISEDVGDFIGLAAMILLVVPAVGIFIYTSTKMNRYEYLQRPFKLQDYVKEEIQEKHDAFSSTYTKSIIIGVSLCILAPIAPIAGSLMDQNVSTYGVVILLALVAVAVYIFIYFGAIKECMTMILQRDEYSIESKVKGENKLISAVAIVVWSLAVCIFLVTGLIYHKWHINWIVFPITGILFGMFSGAYSVMKGN